MPDESKVMRWGLILAAAVIVLRIVLEQAGAPEKLSFFFGVAWLYFIFPILFALSIRAHNAASPFKSLLKNVLLFVLCTRLMVMITYMLAYIFSWKASRFAFPAGTVGENVSVWAGIFFHSLAQSAYLDCDGDHPGYDHRLHHAPAEAQRLLACSRSAMRINRDSKNIC